MSTAPGDAALRSRTPLWVRIALAVMAAFLLAELVAGAWLGTQITAVADRELEASLHADLDLLEPVVERELREGRTDLVKSLADAAHRRAALRVTILTADGNVIAESDRQLPIAAHLDRPEIQDALRNGSGRAERRSTTTGERYIYAARRVGPADAPLGFVRVARPMRAIDAFDSELLHVIVAAALLGIPVAAFVGWLAARRIARPLEEMTETAGRMAAGDFSRLPRATSADEVGRLASALERLGREFSGMLAVRDAATSERTAVIESMSEGVLALDRDCRVLHANPAVAECLQLPGVPAAGTPIAEIVRLPEITAQLRRALAGHRAPEIDVTLPGTTGRVLGVSAAPVTAASSVAGAVVVLRDVTVIRRLERTRLDFVANVSHELRTPLAAVLASVETLRDLGDEDPEARVRLLDTAQRHCRRLAAIVDDLLALSQIESEGDRLERGPVPVLRTIRAAVSAVARDAETRGVNLVAPIDGAPDAVVLGHEGRLEQVWTNLVANAVKYNKPGGTVTVEVAVDAAAKCAEISVRDTGQGIPADHLPRIFERFYRVDKGRSRDQGGTGLGLAIVKHIVLAHRGTIRVESAPGVGSVFRVRIPLADGRLLGG